MQKGTPEWFAARVGLPCHWSHRASAPKIMVGRECRTQSGPRYPNRSWGVQVAAGSFMPGCVPLVGQYERSNVQLDGGK